MTRTLSLNFLGPEIESLWRPVIDRMEIAITSHDLPKIVIADQWLDPRLEAINQRAVAASHQWLLITHTPQWLAFGPQFTAETGCWACMAQRARVWVQFAGCLESQSRLQASSSVSERQPPPEVVKDLIVAAFDSDRTQQPAPDFCGRMLETQLSDGRRSAHYLTRQPHCVECGVPKTGARPDTGQILPRRLPICVDATGFRSSPAAETLRRCLRQLSPRTGVIDLLTPIRAADEQTDIYVYGGGHNFPFHQDLTSLNSRAIQGRSGGKGTDARQARLSAMAETIERHCGTHHRDEYSVRTSLNALGADGIDPGTAMLFSSRQYGHRDIINQTASPKQQVPRPFDPSCEMSWTPIWSLSHQNYRWLPSAYCYYGHDETFSLEFCRADSNGAAAGNSLEEAILQGTLELIERDCVAMWWFNRIRRPGIAIEDIDSPFISEMIRFYPAIGRTLELIDLTNDLKIPAFAAISANTERPTEDILYGFSAHVDPTIAIVRAVLEVNQSLPLTRSVRANGTTRYARMDDDCVEWWSRTTRQSHPFLVPQQPAATPWPSEPFSDLAAVIDHCVTQLRARGIELLVLDQSRPDIDLHVVKVFAPGLRHFWPRFGPGRLYTVPVELGWLDHPRNETDLNPDRIYF